MADAASNGSDPGQGESSIFLAVAEALIGGPVDPGVAEAAGPFLAALPKQDRRLLSILLQTLEYGAPALRFRLRRFTNLPVAEREQILRTWSESRIPARRQGIAALKALAMIGHYGRSEAWPHAGYRGPWLGRAEVRVLPVPELRAAASPNVQPAETGTTPARPCEELPPGIFEGRRLTHDLRLRTRVCVVGTGAGGSAALAALAAAGVDALAVEAGPYSTAEDFTQRELEMLPLLYQDAALRATSDKAIGILQGRGVGGSTLHNTGMVYPTPPAILDRWRRESGFEASPEEMDRFVASAVSTLRAVPIPPHQINPNNAALKRGAEALGWRYRVALHNRDECSGCGYCMLGCAYNRKANAALTFLPEAVRHGARILSDCRAERVERASGGWRVVCRTAPGPSDAGIGDRSGPARAVTVEADVLVLALGALDTPAILLRSGLGNRRVGRGLRLHPAIGVSAVFPDRIVAWRGVPQSVLIEEFASFLDDGYGGWIGIPSAANWPSLAAVMAPGMGADHHARIGRLPNTAAASVLLHDETEGRVTVGRDGRPRTRYWPDRAERATLRSGIRALARLYLAAGAERVDLPDAAAPPVHSMDELDGAVDRVRIDRFRVSVNSVHPQGTCAIDVDPRRGAARPTGELWDMDGIYVADASLFPTSVGVPPQVTIMALGMLVADRVRQRLA